MSQLPRNPGRTLLRRPARDRPQLAPCARRAPQGPGRRPGRLDDDRDDRQGRRTAHRSGCWPTCSASRGRRWCRCSTVWNATAWCGGAPCPLDRRVKLAHLTDDGKALYARVRKEADSLPPRHARWRAGRDAGRCSGTAGAAADAHRGRRVRPCKRRPRRTPRPINRPMITISIMLATIMQVLDTTIANVALPHMQGTLSALAGPDHLGADLLHRRRGDRDAGDRLAVPTASAASACS